jgi:hypothetical protein
MHLEWIISTYIVFCINPVKVELLIILRGAPYVRENSL